MRAAAATTDWLASRIACSLKVDGSAAARCLRFPFEWRRLTLLQGYHATKRG
jgi:hypothetical protein